MGRALTLAFSVCLCGDSTGVTSSDTLDTHNLPRPRNEILALPGKHTDVANTLGKLKLNSGDKRPKLLAASVRRNQRCTKDN
ncbi:hypothetical protein HZ326_5225 [Fusarium oxysporum f. sp. albedinis]|nr:hypothetical protein HZ326_5225 [Fusarium oxysporum f. sp. albedinis]